MPQTLQLLDATTVLPALEEIRAEFAALRREITPPSDPTETTPPEWLPISKLAARYGLSTTATARYIACAQSAGTLRSFRPTDLNGTPGNPLYNLSDYHRYITRTGITTGRTAPGTRTGRTRPKTTTRKS